MLARPQNQLMFVCGWLPEPSRLTSSVGCRPEPVGGKIWKFEPGKLACNLDCANVFAHQSLKYSYNISTNLAISLFKFSLYLYLEGLVHSEHYHATRPSVQLVLWSLGPWNPEHGLAHSGLTRPCAKKWCKPILMYKNTKFEFLRKLIF